MIQAVNTYLTPPEGENIAFLKLKNLKLIMLEAHFYRQSIQN